MSGREEPLELVVHADLRNRKLVLEIDIGDGRYAGKEPSNALFFLSNSM